MAAFTSERGFLLFMSKSLTIVYVTMRQNPRLEWFMDSLHKQSQGMEYTLVVVSRFGVEQLEINSHGKPYRVVRPKPSVWQGEHRLTKEDWFAASNARNTGLCLANSDWI